MITLYTFGPAFGLPDPSPFVTKAHLLLRMAGLPYETSIRGYRRAPKGKLPYIVDDGAVIADSTFIRLHLERKYQVDFDRDLDAEQCSTAWTIERMCEDHLYWTGLYERWLKDGNFEKGPAAFFKRAPAVLRPVIKAFIRRRIRRDLRSQGIGRHTDAEIGLLARRDVDAIAVLLRDKDWIGGARPCGADASVGAFVIGVLCPVFDTDGGRAARSHANLVAYGERVMARYFPVVGE